MTKLWVYGILGCLFTVIAIAPSYSLSIQRLSDCESTIGWSNNAKLTNDAREGKFAIAVELRAGGVNFLTFDFTHTGIDLSKAYALAFWWKAKGRGLRNFMVKVRNHPLANGMEAVYLIWDASMGTSPTEWHHAVVVLSKPLYDDWGGKPNKQARYITFRVQTERASQAQLLIDNVVALPPTFELSVSMPMSYENQCNLQVSMRNLTAEPLVVNIGSNQRQLAQIRIAPRQHRTYTLTLPSVTVQLARLQPLQPMYVQLWAEVAGLLDTRVEKVVRVVKPMKLPPHPRLLLNREGVAQLKARIERYEWAKVRWEAIKRSAERWLAQQIELPPRGGNWWHWYACPKHGAGLRRGKQIGKWQWEHICPVGKELLRGDPERPQRDYDGCVIMGIHHGLARAVRELGLAYQVTGDERYAKKAREILLAYAERYLSYPLHTVHGASKVGGGRVGSQTLDESTWLITLSQGADLVWQTLTDNDRTIIAEKLLLPAARDVILPHKIGVHNIQCWKNSAVGLVGFLLGDAELIYEAIYNRERGYWTQMHKGVLPDGVWWEGAWGYHFYTLSALWNLTEAARNCGINLYGDELKGMFDAPLRFAMPNLRLPAFNDSGEVDLRGRATFYELAFARYHDTRYVTLLRMSNRQNDFALWFGVGDLPTAEEIKWQSANYPRAGYAILARGKGDQATWLCLKYGPHGGGHGHPDKLNFILYARGLVIAPDPGTARYGIPIQRGWYRTTLAHNTLTVDEASQRPAEGKCIAFGNEHGVDFVVADAGNIYDGVKFVRTVALLNESLIAFVDQIRCTRERLLDVAYHNRGTWEALPDGAKWSPPNKLGYSYLRNATVRNVEDGMALTVRVRDDLRTVITFATDPEAKLITATGVGAHVEDRVPIAFLRCRARQATFAWCISLNGKPARIEWLPVCGEDGNALPKAVAVAMRIVNADGQAWHIVANPDCQSITVQLTSGTKWHTERAFAVR